MDGAKVGLVAYGARLLTGHLQAKGERFAGLVTTAASEDIQRGADGLVAVTATLLLIYARESDQDARDAMAEAALGIEEGTDTQEFADVVRLILEVNEGVVAPQAVQANAEAVGAVAEGLAARLASLIAVVQKVHPNKIVAQLSKQSRTDPAGLQMSDSDSLRKASMEAASDQSLQKLRLDALNTLMYAMRCSAFRLGRLGESRTGNPEGLIFVAVANVAITAQQLAQGAGNLVELRNYYSAAALARQLVEFEYLMWAFDDDPGSIGDWVQSDRDAREARWGPKAIYARDGNHFRRSDYGRHCEQGGHPTPAGIQLSLPDPDRGTAIFALQLSDLIFHVAAIWSSQQSLLTKLAHSYGFEESKIVHVDERDRARSCLDKWKEFDRLGHISSHYSDPTGRVE
ncbi:hypothetical protein F6X56_02780 [Rhodococcus erythropolis]|uniref:Uncharacterized protein n=1 Tax=Rhodococcus qingshengii JCM 15477 TaxID=1303681 RepID=A0AB38RCU7_RHOSG|nr:MULTISPECIES: hypothetical protein [Rhodococcus]MCJ0949448.1 hypothetical protein [Rhodococcus sp. ARC_M8]QEX08705.1 hypothetical protein F6X56_02780 [Rhodococcus erythropolis]ULD43721.1 hypothetical protein JKI97_12070 [Rhodococcus qingshengii]UPU43163.1 hypothetical protein M0639_00195 [Rhodococcus qingshengii JCM 15477]